MSDNCNFKVNEYDEILCAAYYPIRLLNTKWRAPIIFTLFSSPLTFAQFLSELHGIDDEELGRNLFALERQNIVVNTFTGRMEAKYQLTEKGRSLHRVLNELQTWGLEYLKLYQEECNSMTLENETGQG